MQLQIRLDLGYAPFFLIICKLLTANFIVVLYGVVASFFRLKVPSWLGRFYSYLFLPTPVLVGNTNWIECILENALKDLS